MSTKIDPSDQEERDRNTQAKDFPVCYLKPGERLSPEMVCPRCGKGKIQYNGLLNLVCPHCGLTEAGACT